MEVAGFIIGLSGIAVVFDTTCTIWRRIVQASDYGEDVAKALNKLEMEFFRFQAWWFALENIVSSPQNRLRPLVPFGATSLVEHLQIEIQNPVEKAASSVQQLLEELERILSRDGALAIATAGNSYLPSGLLNQGASALATGSQRSTARFQALSKDLLRGTSWFRRVKHSSAPWRGADQESLTRIHNDFTYWNNSLYSILPHNIRESVLQQGIAGYLIDVPENGLQAGQDTGGQNAVIVECARLVELRRKMRVGTSVNDASKIQQNFAKAEDKTRGIMGVLPTSYNSRRPFSVMEYIEDKSSTPSQVLVEWYEYPPSTSGPDTKRLAQDRIARLSVLLHDQNRPSTLRSLNTTGFINNPSMLSFGLIYQFPKTAFTTLEPVTLFQLLSRQIPGNDTTAQKPSPLPTLETRYEIAARLASTLYTFMLTQWHHKRFNSTSIFFLRNNGSHSNPTLSLDKPYVGGYAISRPDAPSEDTFRGVPNAETEMYLHPDLVRTSVGGPHKKFQRVFEVYSFGTLLAEIGWWNVLPKIALGTATRSQARGNELRTKLIEKCKTDLACWMGEKYRDVTLRCLNAERTEDGGVGEDLNEFYWHVVLELVKLIPSN